MAWNLLETGGKLVGWKVGATNAPARKQRGIADFPQSASSLTKHGMEMSILNKKIVTPGAVHSHHAAQ